MNNIHLQTPLIEKGQVDETAVVQNWLLEINSLLSSIPVSKDLDLSPFFHEDSWWRDHLALQWDLRTIRGRDGILEFLAKHQQKSQLTSLQLRSEGPYPPVLESPCPDLQWLRAIFTFESKYGVGTGVVRLTQDPVTKAWKAFSVYTVLLDLKHRRERSGHRRPEGNVHTLPDGRGSGTWAEKRQIEKTFHHEQPTVLVVGGGQAGLDVAARLKALGISCLIVERNPRIGDNWRNRYKTLTTHDPVVTCHMPYLPFPKTWPQFTPKDKLADWFEAYASIMELDVWTNTAVVGGQYDDEKKVWSITIQRKNATGPPAARVTIHPRLQSTTSVIHPRYVVWATGHSGEPKVPEFPGQEEFKGMLYHATEHHDASEYDVKGKKVVVVGTGNSGHDIAENFYTNGAEVTLVQRGPTYVCTQKKGLFILNKGLKDEDCPSIEDADLIGESLPIPVQLKLAEHVTTVIAKQEQPTLIGLARAGFRLDGTPLWTKYVTKGGGYYIDIGCSQLIIDGKIKVKHEPNGIRRFGRRELILANGAAIPADIVVLATGYDNMRTTVRQALGDKVADRLHDIWDLDSEGELNAVWRPSGQEHFWYMAGNLALCRYYSRHVALQIAAKVAGLNDS